VNVKPPRQSFVDLMKEKRENGVTDIHSIGLSDKQRQEAVELAQRLLLEARLD
jgi:hypothetical protein